MCIFAYGQTGSGKTHTMEGAHGDARGVVPRAAEQVFAAAQDLSGLGWTFTFEVSCLEVYNEELRDLVRGLHPAPCASYSRLTSLAIACRAHLSLRSNTRVPQLPAPNGKKAEGKLEIRGTSAGAGVQVPGLRAAGVGSAAELAGLLASAQKVRATSSTKCNEHSSRSHYLFRMAIKVCYPQIDQLHISHASLHHASLHHASLHHASLP